MHYNIDNTPTTLSSSAREIILGWLEEWKSETEPSTWKELAEIENLSYCHFGLGLYIRNQYLWKDPDIVSELGGGHPDTISHMILNIWRNELRKQFAEKT